YSFASQPEPQQYSSAADVSSFSYSSPVVSYNNLGFLHQIIGKGAGAQQQQPQQQQQQQVYSAAPRPKVQYTSSPSQYSAPQNTYDISNAYQGVAQKAAYSESPQAQYQAQAQAQAYAQAQAQAAQAQALAEAQAQAKAQSQQQQSQAHAITFQTSSPVAQKLSYSSAPSYQAIQALQKPSAQVNYVGSPQQVAYSAPQGSSQAYETAAHSAPQISYSQPGAQPQYYSVPQGAKYLRAGITYAQ
ncbi:general transcriptional corepressor CYC8-like, partial [Anoplophora glabripennis]